jgi:hypothetical protein
VVTKKTPAKSKTTHEEKTEDLCIALARRLGSLHIGSGDNGASETSSVPQIRRLWATHYSIAVAPNNLPVAEAASARVELVDVPGADELGSAVALPKVKPDANLDTNEADTDNEGVDEAKERLVGWPQRCGTVSRGPGRGDFGGAGGQARQEGEGVVMGWGAREGAISIGWRERPGLVGG